MSRDQRRYFVATLLIMVAARSASCFAHETPIDIRVDPVTQQLLPQVNNNFALLDNFATLIFTDSPGFGVTFPVNGVSTGTTFELEAVGPLLYWNGTGPTTTTAELTFENPAFDSLGNPVSSPVTDYAINQTSARKVGMVWGTYTGAPQWHADGFFELASGSAPGIYGVPLRLHGSGLERSDTFLFPLVYDPSGTWTLAQRLAAIGELRAELIGLGIADFNNDFEVDGSDLTLWQNGFGQTGPIEPADGNDDDWVDGSDLLTWQQQFGTVTAPPVSLVAVPEPAALSCFLFLASTLMTWRRSRTIFN
ncbi:MAG: hypothetical protein RH917_03355 [Lacipirellulaceae bacterium]